MLWNAALMDSGNNVNASLPNDNPHAEAPMDPIEHTLNEKPLCQAWGAPRDPLPIVLIGGGGIARSAHLPAYRRLGLPVLGVFEPKADVAAALVSDFGIPTMFPNLQSALESASESRAVFDLAVPPGEIRSVLEQIPSGSAVLIQKPFGRDLSEARVLLTLCREKSLCAAVNFQLRFSPNILALKDAVDRGLLGQIVDAEVRINVHTPWQNWDFLKGIPRHEILYHSIHYMDLLRSFFGEPQGVYCRVTRNPTLVDYSDTSSATILNYGDHLRCVVSTFHGHAYGSHHAMSQLKIVGTSGAAVLRLGVNLDYPTGQPDSLELVNQGSTAWHNVPLRGGWFDHAFEGPMSNLQRYAQGLDENLVSDVADAARTMALVEACYESSHAGSTPIPEIN